MTKVHASPSPRLSGAVAIVLLLLAILLALRTTPAPGARARAIEASLRCPTCQGTSIADSPAVAARQMRALVEEQLGAGATDEEIRAYFVARYGRSILLDPPRSGLDLILYIAPAAIVLLGARIVVRRARGDASVTGTKPAETRAPAIGRGWLAFLSIATVAALVVPIAATAGPRLAGQPISGGSGGGGATIAELEAYVAVEPWDVEALVMLGNALLEGGRPLDAADRFGSALKVDAASQPALVGLAASLLEVGRPEAAGPLLDRALADTPDQPDALLYRAIARLRVTGMVNADVRADVERFLAVATPDDPRRAMAAGLLDGSAGSAPPTGALP